jgi:uncharacterized OB-fold protein
MRHTLAYVLAKPTDFKICTDCGQLNWYERESCCNCANKEFKKVSEKYILGLIRLYGDDSAEVEV